MPGYVGVGQDTDIFVKARHRCSGSSGAAALPFGLHEIQDDTLFPYKTHSVCFPKYPPTP